VEVWYGQRKVEDVPRLRGRSKHRIDYRHIIEWLVRKPGAFENYRYQEDLFPTSRFRMAYDALHNGRQLGHSNVCIDLKAPAADRQDRLCWRLIRADSIGYSNGNHTSTVHVAQLTSSSQGKVLFAKVLPPTFTIHLELRAVQSNECGLCRHFRPTFLRLRPNSYA
jgi:hypothetical protein